MSDVSVLGKGRWTVRYNFPANFSRQDVQAAKNWVKQAVSCTPDSISLEKKLTQPRQSPHYRGIVAEIEEEKAGKRQRLWPEVCPAPAPIPGDGPSLLVFNCCNFEANDGPQTDACM